MVMNWKFNKMLWRDEFVNKGNIVYQNYKKLTRILIKELEDSPDY